MSKELAKNESSDLVVSGSSGNQEVLSSDVVIPKLLLMQGLSELVTERKAQQGDMVISTNARKLGDPETPVEFIPLSFKTFWTEFENVGGTLEYRNKVERNALNEYSPWEFQKDGATWRRVKVLEVYALLPDDIAKEVSALAKAKETGELPDLDATLLPVVLSFRSTSYKAGMSVVTHFTKAKTLSLHMGREVQPYAYKMKLSSVPDKNDKGAYFVFKVDSAGQCNSDEVAVAEKWHSTVNAGNIRVDDSDESEPSVAKAGKF